MNTAPFRFASFLLFVTAVFAIPLVSQTAGPNVVRVASGAGSLVITGSSFGDKPQAQPLKWDDFEAGIVGQRVGNGWYTTSNGIHPAYANDRVRPGTTRSVKQVFTSKQYNATFGLTGLGRSRLYVSFWKYSAVGGDGPSRNYKVVAFRGGAPGVWGAPNGRHDIYPVNGSGHIYTADCDGTGTNLNNEWGGAFEFAAGKWQRFEYYIDMGTPGVADGSYGWWLDGIPRTTLTNRLIRTAACTFNNLYISSYFATDTNGAAATFWLDDVYVDSTQARVEVCESSSWNSRGHCEIQIPTAWSSSSITVTANRGSFTAEQFSRGYVYVVDSKGNASPAVRIAEGTAPAAPGGVTVTR